MNCRKSTRVSLITMGVLLFMFAMALTLVSFDITNFVHEAQITLAHNPEMRMVDKYDAAQQKLFHLLAPLDLLYAIEALLGDGVIIWRVWVLWGNTKRREYRKLIKPVVNNVHVRGPSRTHRVERVMILLVESGVIYFIFFLVIVIGNIPNVENNPGISFAFFVYSYSTSVVVGLYPTVITLIANSDSAVLDTAISTTLGSNVNTLKLPNSTIERGSSRRTRDLELSTFATEVTADDRHEGKKAVTTL
ncbi:hypothetical protein C0991_003618 [Blastosporella zonata]|nr:hypothetical protein C0991_003618 [Blastosporella zonata]